MELSNNEYVTSYKQNYIELKCDLENFCENGIYYLPIILNNKEYLIEIQFSPDEGEFGGRYYAYILPKDEYVLKKHENPLKNNQNLRTFKNK